MGWQVVKHKLEFIPTPANITQYLQHVHTHHTADWIRGHWLLHGDKDTAILQ